MKSSTGAYVTVVSPTITTAPFTGCVTDTTFNSSPSASVSFARTDTVTGVSSGVVTTSLPAIGTSFTPPTSTVTVADAVRPWPSSTVYPNASEPTKSGAGVYVTVVSPTITTAPFTGCVTTTTLNSSPSTSVSFARTDTVTGVSSGVVTASSTATGASFTGVTVTLNRTTTLSTPPFATPSLSFTTTATCALPLESAAGV